jgi:sensor domain CHASE-containing protein
VKISTRTLAILAATVFIFVITLFIVANAFIQSTYSQIELQQSDTNIQLVTEQIQYEFEQLGTKARDWAVWDDTYQFMEDKNAHYHETVIDAPTTYESLQLSGLILYDANGTVVASQGYDLTNKTRINLSNETLSEFSKTLNVLSNTRGGKKKQGIILLSEGPVLIGMHTILQSNGMGYGHGTLVMIQPFNEHRIASIQNRLHLPIRIRRLDSLTTTVTSEIAVLSGNNYAPSPISRIQNSSTIVGFLLLMDIENHPALIVDIETPRTASQQMHGALLYLIAAFAITGVIYILVTGLLLRHQIITPLTDLDTAMKNIGRRGDLSERLSSEGDDEIASLKESFNAMLQDIQDKETELKTQANLLAESHRKANLYLDIYLDVLTYEILNVTISLQAYAELIRESGDETNKEYADRITVALNRNLSVIRNIEIISKIYKHPPGRTQINLKNVVEKEILKFPDRNIRYSMGDVMVTADNMLGIVFHNILLNCLQFGKDDLFIEITARDLPDGMVEISIVDNGSGIADDLKLLIFDRFIKDSEKRSSYGLGLHIVKMLIEAYGGTVWADDRVPGKPEYGAAIRFTLKKG